MLGATPRFRSGHSMRVWKDGVGQLLKVQTEGQAGLCSCEWHPTAP